MKMTFNSFNKSVLYQWIQWIVFSAHGIINEMKDSTISENKYFVQFNLLYTSLEKYVHQFRDITGQITMQKVFVRIFFFIKKVLFVENKHLLAILYKGKEKNLEERSLLWDTEFILDKY